MPAAAPSVSGTLPRVGRLVVNRVAAAGLEGLALGLAARPAAERARHGPAGPAGDHAGAVAGADVMLVDRRRGLDDAVLDALCHVLPPRRRGQLQPRAAARGGPAGGRAAALAP
jgi:hypothetical protein